MPHILDIDSLNEEFKDQEPWKILQWAEQIFQQKIAATSSFQTQSLPLLHMISKYSPTIPVMFLNTGFHFPETLTYLDTLQRDLGVSVQLLTPQMGHHAFLKRYGQLYSDNPDLCCYINKVEPLERARRNLDAWISGIRRDQTIERSNTKIITQQADGKYKIAPMAFWSQSDINNYIEIYELPVHPLYQLGYRSIGCEPCTQAISKDDSYRDGRWAGSSKRECGLHDGHFEKPQHSKKVTL